MNIRQSRQIWRRAHPVRLPSRDTSPHLELRHAFERDMALEEMRYLLETEVEKDLREERE